MTSFPFFLRLVQVVREEQVYVPNGRCLRHPAESNQAEGEILESKCLKDEHNLVIEKLCF